MDRTRQAPPDNQPSPDPYPFVYRFFAAIFYCCLRGLIRVEEATDLRKLPHPVIFAYNHNNYYETIVLSSYLLHRWRQRRLCFVVDWMFGHLPVIGWLLQSVRPVYVYNKPARWGFLNRRKPPGRQNPLQECLQRLQQGYSLGIFPEGSRNHHPLILKRGRQGVGELTLQAAVPVIPVGIDFPNRQQRHRIPAVGRIIFRFGAPLHFSAEMSAWRQIQADKALSAAEREKRRRYLGHRITHAIMQELARLSGKLYPYRRSDDSALRTSLASHTLGGGKEDGQDSNQQSA